jgi:flagellin
MRINTNVSALTALSNLNKVQDAIGSSMQKLSSGFRINKAGDDAAGLGISNQMGADIKAMTQASRNAEQAGSVLQIMDGATSNVQSILERMKELAAQSASDTVDSGARGKIDSEFGTLTSELDRIVSTTKFQGASLLNGTFGSKVSNAGTVNVAGSSFSTSPSISSIAVSSAPTYTASASTITASVTKSGNAVAGTVTGSATTVVAVTNQANVDTLTTAPVAVSSAFQTTTIGAGTLVDGTQVSGPVANNVSTAGGSGSLAAGTWSFTAVAGAGTSVDITLHNSANGTGAAAGTVNVLQAAANFSINGLTFTLGGTSNTQAGLVAATNTKNFTLTQNYNVGLTGGGKALQTVALADDGSASQTIDFGSYGVSLQANTGTAAALNGKALAVSETDQLTLAGTNPAGVAQTQTLAYTAGAQALNFNTFGLTVNTGAGTTVAGFKAEVNGGANSIVQNGARSAQFLVSSSQSYTTNDLINLSAIDLTATTLGVNRAAVDLTTATGAQTALTTIDSAITSIGTAIGSIGAAENRVMYANNNVKTAIQNFTAAQSAIKDVDMADEMTTFSKNQILSQASTAMLAQANQLGQSVLKLLQ